MNFKVFAAFVAIFLMAIAAKAFAASSVEGNTDSLNAAKSQRESPLVQPRITCDILGSDAWCAVHCIGKGFRGGYCNKQKVCVCRR
ncbi:U-Asilidin(12)-Dg3a-like [Sitodiplosis mosellana]|uniref:U-Asilidin(12)-Dg3a-like n=1 Tax=Sitodiplosis mosellana TaxID=263140 RepID=UPI00244448F0|nr:U-Asilidin(12)-Dg3a-like [Sitodiplosis mosellana]